MLVHRNGLLRCASYTIRTRQREYDVVAGLVSFDSARHLTEREMLLEVRSPSIYYLAQVNPPQFSSVRPVGESIIFHHTQIVVGYQLLGKR